MGVITISLNDQTEKELRKLAKAKYSMKKGAMAKVITEALEKWKKQKEDEIIIKESLELLKKGFDMGKITYKNRAELHER